MVTGYIIDGVHPVAQLSRVLVHVCVSPQTVQCYPYVSLCVIVFVCGIKSFCLHEFCRFEQV